jgi:ATP-binding cassette, subfamily B, multidrug efflux pump
MSKLGDIFDWVILRRILSLVSPYKKVFWLTVVLVILLSLLAPLRPWLIQYTVDNPIANGDFDGLLGLTAIMVVTLVLESIFRYAFSYASTWLGQAAVRDLRQRLFDHLAKMRLKFFDRTPIGTLTTRTVSDVETISEVFSQGLLTIVGDVLQLITLLIFMLITDWKLTLISLSVLPLLLYSTWLFKEKVKSSFQEVRVQVARLNAFVQEHITGMTVVQLFNREEAEAKKFREINGAHNEANLKSIFYYSVFFPVVDIITAVSLGLLVWWGAHGALRDELTTGTLIAFILYVNQFFRPIRLLADKFNSLQMGMVASERVFKLLDTDESLPDTGSYRPEQVAGRIDMEGVWFAYDDDNYVLRDISFSLAAGQKLALVGSTGAGKSSIINVLGRFYDYQKGEVQLDGVNIREYPLEQLRRHIGIILQDVFLFSGTIAENISMKNPDITLDQIKAMAEYTGISSFIEKLPGQYDYQVNERGYSLSAGQRQLIAFLRAMVYNPAILVLDEATSSIDSETEHLLQLATAKLTEGRTAILIAHRLSTIREADQILVIDKGTIAEQGTHRELLRKKGLYRKLYEMQFHEELT